MWGLKERDGDQSMAYRPGITSVQSAGLIAKADEFREKAPPILSEERASGGYARSGMTKWR